MRRLYKYGRISPSLLLKVHDIKIFEILTAYSRDDKIIISSERSFYIVIA